VGSGFYWRAWNQYQQGRLEAAAADIARAKGLLINDDVMTLSGMVAYDQKRAADARADFDDAVRMNPEKCIARWYLGLLNLDEEAWLPAVSSFGSAGGCYQRAADTLRSEIARLPADLPADVRAQQLTTFDRNISASLRQAGRSFFNAAQASLRVGDTAAAAAHAHAAAGYEEMKERAEVLIETLERNR
jgi:tetratricopeptide (TPR) repeat protein